jgi:uncharacterized protein (TIGR03083 family)
VTDTRRDIDGPWPLTTDLVRAELAAYLEDAADPALRGLQTRCTPWTVSDLTAHLALTFRRYLELLRRSRAGKLDPPFAPEDLSAQNLRAVSTFRGDPFQALEASALRFLHSATDADELIAHQFGPIPIGLQILFGLNELAIHHDDVEYASRRRYRPPSSVVRALVPVWERVLGGLPPADNEWAAMLAASGR